MQQVWKAGRHTSVKKREILTEKERENESQRQRTRAHVRVRTREEATERGRETIERKHAQVRACTSDGKVVGESKQTRGKGEKRPS